MPSEEACGEALREARWPLGVLCIHCHSPRLERRGWRGQCRRYRCKACGGWFNDRTGTPMEHSRLPMRECLFAAYQLQSKVSVRELSERLKRPYRTVYRLVGRLRENLYLTAPTTKLGGIVEMDEVYVTAGLKGKRGLRRQPRHRGLRRRGRGRYASDKPPILGVVERRGLVRLIPMGDVAARTVLRHLHKTVETENLEAIYTDDYPAYNALRSLGQHETVNHSLGEYARGKVHINTVEGEYSVFRPWLRTYRGISREKTHIYAAHYNFLRNTRRMDHAQRAVQMIITSAPTSS